MKPPGDRPRRPRAAFPAPISFRSVNRRGTPGHDPGLQRHHLLPRQLLQQACFGQLFDAIGHERVGFNDFRRNGLLLPAAESAALRLGSRSTAGRTATTTNW